MRAGIARLDAAAHNIAAAGIATSDAVPPILAIQSELPGGGVTTQLTMPASGTLPDTADAVVDVMEATLTYRANASVMHAADTMMGSLLDICR